MTIPLSVVKILKTEFENQLLPSNLTELLLQGDLYNFEEELSRKLQHLYDIVCKELLKHVVSLPVFTKKIKAKATELGLKKIVEREVEVQLQTGTKMKANSLYAKKTPKGYDGNRHLPLIYFGCDNKSGLMYQSVTCLLSVVCPSFKKKRPIGSGVVESGIRRIINLRFKSPSSFWYPENVEKLIYMRGIVLSGRWKIMIENLKNI